MRKVLDVLQDHIWAIHPAKLDDINAFVQRIAIDGEQIQEQAAAAGKSGNKAEDRYEIRDGIAVIPVYGSLMKRANVFTKWSGGTSYQLIERDIKMAVADETVDAIVLDIDSPGGSTDGIFELADAIYTLRGTKPIIAAGNGMLTSAAYLIASATDGIMVGTSTNTGSIGVYSVHYDLSKQDEMRGIHRTEITAGRYKAIGSDLKPLSEEERAYIQEKVDYLYSLFLESVARNRGMDIEQVLAMADGKIFIGQQALDVGLVDRMGTLADAMASASNRSSQIFFRRKGVSMTAEELKTQNPDLYAEVHQLGIASANVAEETARARAEGNAAGQAEERKRVVDILAIGGDPAVLHQAIQQGLSVEATYKELYVADDAARRKAIAAMESESAGHAAKEKTTNEQPDGTAFLAEVEKYQAEKKCKRSEAIRAIVKTRPDLHEAYLLNPQGKGE